MTTFDTFESMAKLSKMIRYQFLSVFLCAGIVRLWRVSSFPTPTSSQRQRSPLSLQKMKENGGSVLCNDEDDMSDIDNSRRSLFTKTAQTILSTALPSTVGMLFSPLRTQASVGTLPDFETSNFILQGLTVNIADFSQLENMIVFLKEGLGFSVLRQRQVGTITEAWLGFGPEEMSIPKDFVSGPSSFGQYGGHASLHLRYDAKATELYYNGKGDVPGNNIAYFQVGVPSYRISQMVNAGGEILDAYGIVNVVSPTGLPMRAIIGIRPDPIMFVAINTQDIEKSRTFYEQFGMVKQPFPYARPSNGTGQFEPPQPVGSLYLAQTPFSMGVLLLPITDKKLKKAGLVPNSAVRSLNIVYNQKVLPSDEMSSATTEQLLSKDPSQVGITLNSYDLFLDEVKVTEKNANILKV